MVRIAAGSLARWGVGCERVDICPPSVNLMLTNVTNQPFGPVILYIGHIETDQPTRLTVRSLI